MRCKNCGWEDNPAGSAKCVKCNVPLEGSMIDEVVAVKTERQTGSEEFNPGVTERGCQECGFPISSTGTRCPNCGRSYSDSESVTDRVFGVTGEPKQCPKCCYPLRSTDTLCPKCGFQTTSEEPSTSEEPPIGGGTKIQRILRGILVTYNLSPTGDFFPIYDGTNTVGRNKTNQIVISDDAVSGVHFEIAYYTQNNKFYFDIGTKGLTQNGAYVNDKFMVKGTEELSNNDVITVGSIKLLFIAIPDKILNV